MEHTRILVLLDGSPAAERGLEEALILAKALQAGVVLLQVVPPIEDVLRERAMTLAIDEVWEMQRHGALQYLNNVRARPEWKDVVTEASVELGDPAETILDVCEKRGIDRIVMATHGRTGVKRWVLGSVAEKVLRAADRTVVLVRAGPAGVTAASALRNCGVACSTSDWAIESVAGDGFTRRSRRRQRSPGAWESRQGRFAETLSKA